MCGGHGNSEGKVPSLTESESSSKKGLTSDASQDSSFLLLELASKNDLEKFRKCVEKEGLNRVDNVGTWYVGRNGSRKMCVERRTPAMIAALYGSLDVLMYIVKEVYMTYCGDINQTCGSDGTTALHCAVAGGSTFAVETTKFLVASGADVNVIDAMGRTAADMINVSYRPGNVKRKALEEILARKPSKGSDVSSDEFESILLPSGEAYIEEAGSLLSSSSAVCCDFGGSMSCSSSSTSPKSPLLTGSKLLGDGNEKAKGYPTDPSLPDIKNSIYTTDEFRMYTFKVRPCSRAYSHDWTECPFVHPGENARRRDPRRYHYSCVPCPEFRKGACRRGDSCEYAHGVFECWLHPAQYRTRLCKDGIDCNRRVCFFAHTPEELRPLYVSTGSAVPSPRSSGCMDMSCMSPPLTPGCTFPYSPSYPLQKTIQGCLGTPPTSPQSISANCSLAGTLSLSHQSMPSLHLPGPNLQGSRLRSALHARDAQLNDFECELLGDFQQSLSIQSLSAQARLNAAVAVSTNGNLSLRSGKYRSLGLTLSPTNLDDLFASESVCSPKSLSHELMSLSQLEAQMQSSPTQHQSHFLSRQTSLQRQLSAQQQAGLEAQFQSTMLQSPKQHPSCSLGSLCHMDMERREAPLSARSVFAQHDQLGFSSQDLEGDLLWSDWGSPTGKPEWSVHGNEFPKLRRPPSSVKGSDDSDLTWAGRSVKEELVDGCGVAPSTAPVNDGATGVERVNVDVSLIGSWIDKFHLDDHIVA